MGQFKRRRFLLAGATTLAAPTVVFAQSSTKVFRVGMLYFGHRTTLTSLHTAIVQGFRDLGYREGANVVFEIRYADGNVGRLPELAAELLRSKVDVIVTGGGPQTRAAKEATSTIPIVMITGAGDPVRTGFAASLAHPGGNITGISTNPIEMISKRLELLKEFFPKAMRVAAFSTTVAESANPAVGNSLILAETERAAKLIKMETLTIEVQNREDMERAFQSARTWRADAVLVQEAPLFYFARALIGDLAIKYHLPAMSPTKDYAQAGALLSYGVDYEALFRRTAIFVDRIVKGAKPGDIPIEQPDKFELTVNLKTARAHGLTVPQSILLRADRVIE